MVISEYVKAREISSGVETEASQAARQKYLDV